jgi:eukaryotic-like serine/threonine-protein kinase
MHDDASWPKILPPNPNNGTISFDPNDAVIAKDVVASRAVTLLNTPEPFALNAPGSLVKTSKTVLPPSHVLEPTLVVEQRDRFEPLRPLGHGGMGEVHLVKDHDIERTVAVKRLQQGASLQMFSEEIRTMGELEHANIVPVHDVGIDERGRHYFVMKHLRGESLDKIIVRLRNGDAQTHAKFSFEARVVLFQGILNAVAYAHQQGIIHRDVKPANIMVGHFGEVTVVDWGLAKRIKTSEQPVRSFDSVKLPLRLPRPDTTPGAVMGTPMYMSPEQARGEPLDERSDTYSLSVMFHELLYLTHYLDAYIELPEVLRGVQLAIPDFQPASAHRGQRFVPAELAWFLKKGFSKAPNERYQSASEMTEALARIGAGKMAIQCQRTFAKRVLLETAALVDRFPKTVIVGSMLFAVGTLAALVKTVSSIF